ncbi:TIR domain-containing protein [Kordiimonas sp.]|uniref:TIR domain-containing protein n=1 Tax=Kordiimonas sp. TaxID=1970157 RepID=UPI003A9033A2
MSENEVKSAYQYKAFISYSHKDDEFSAWLLKALEGYRLNTHVRRRISAPSRLGRFFRDRDELPATGHMTDRIFEALRASEYLIVVCSPASVRSKLVNREIAEFKRIRGDSKILCVIIDGVPFAKNPEQECFPEALKLKLTEEGKQSGFAAEGLAADARETGDGKRQALLKLIAGMLNIGLNDLVQRETQRRQRKLMAFAIAASVGMAVTAGLALEARKARLEAESALKLAEAKSIEAAKHLNNNEQLMHLVMNTIYEDLLTAGSLTTLENLSETLLRFLNEREFTQNRASQIALIIPTNLRLGQALERRGETARAAEIFKKTRAIAEELYVNNPDLRIAVGRFATTLFFTGYLAQRLGDYDYAAAEYEYRLRVIEHYMSLPFGPESDSKLQDQIDQRKELMADTLGTLCVLKSVPLGQPQEALALCNKSALLRQEVLDGDPESEAKKTDLATSFFHLAVTHVTLGQYDTALIYLQRRLELYESMLKHEPMNFKIRRRAAMTQQQIVHAEQLNGTLDPDALQKLWWVTQDFDALTSKDPANIMWLADSATVYHDYAEVALRNGEAEKAARALNVAKDQIKRALDADNSRISRRLTAYRVRLLSARLAAAQGDIDDATALSAQAVAALELEGASYLRAHNVLDFAGELYLFHGDQLYAAGRQAEAQASWQKLAELNKATPATKTPVFLKTLETSIARLETPQDAAR